MFQLNNLKSLTKKRKRIGRGGSRGGTSGRGGKGQKARTGHSTMRASFEGGQMPLVRRLPKRGFNNKRFAMTFEIVNLHFLDNKFEVGQEITKALLLQQGLISDIKNAVKILGKGSLTKKLIVHADAASKSARETIEKFGGKIILT